LKPKRKERASAPKTKGTHTKKPSSSGGTNKTFKQEVDSYFVLKYSQLEETTKKIITKYNRTLEASNVISSAYLYIISKEPEILHFSRTFSKSIEHTIYSFTLQYINKALIWPNSKINDEENKFINRTINIDCEDQHECAYQKITTYQHNIYTDEFIESFYKSLKKLDAICFQAFYFEGVDNAKELAIKFDISISSAYTSINRLKKLLKEHINKHKIE
jgi:predicted transcriptional regulator